MERHCKMLVYVGTLMYRKTLQKAVIDFRKAHQSVGINYRKKWGYGLYKKKKLLSVRIDYRKNTVKCGDRL